MGKSRLLLEFAHRLPPDQVTWYGGQCLAYGQTIPYLPVRDVLRQFCGLVEGDNAAAQTAAVQHWLHTRGISVAEERALFCQLLDVPVAPELLAPLSPESRQARTFALLGYLIRQEAQQRPLVLAVEDVHWIDPTSAAWLAFLLDRLAGVAMLLLVTARPGAQPSWGTHARVTQLALPPLRAEESQVIVAAVQGSAHLPMAQYQQILTHGAGNPFFIEELAWHAVEHGLAATPVPETVHAVLAARLDQLPAAAKALLQTAAVIGPEVPVGLLRIVAEVPEDALQQGLGHLQTAEFLYEASLFPDLAYTFKHALTHEVAYGSLLQERRRALHARLVEVLEGLATDRLTEQVARLAHHAVRGELREKALAYCRQAGARATARSAYREAVAYLEQALAALARLPEHHGTLEQAVDLRFDLRNALQPLDEQGRMFEHLRAAEPLAERLGDPQRLGRIVAALCYSFSLMGEHDRAIAAGQQALALATSSGAFDVQINAQNNLSVAY
jgi:predicted ATPase